MRVIAEEAQIATLVDRLAGLIAADIFPVEQRGPLAIVGIRSRGDVLAQRLAERLKPDHVGTLDITLYRDDLAGTRSQPVVRAPEIDFPVDGIDVVLVDDVLMTGRSVRAALQALIDFGRPKRVWLSVLADRGGRELPIAADHVALDLTASPNAPLEDERVEVLLRPTDDRDAIVVRSPELEPHSGARR